ncbi:MAG: hypothetical protein SAK29_01270 [Scytonema sp. PMC 1069.18]|nr:hypothetical protein [Scytonema sp. PMC 1069.18]MEC4811905.1 hypothetical protein [Scytonema sp. PMC 1069.18]MEC4884992.1 hypothetical protein [Scytonema sp. PMC 1070.18]
MLWWLHPIVTVEGIEYKGVDRRVVVPRDTCGDILNELFDLAIDIENKRFSLIVYRDKENLEVGFNLPEKDELGQFNDLRYTVKTYRHILAIFLSLGVLPALLNTEREVQHELMDIDINNRADTLEFFLLNNVRKVPNQRKYFHGRIELDLLKLVQEMYLLAMNGNSRTRWMLSFNTPLQIWFITIVQMVYTMYFTKFDGSKRKYYEHISSLEKNLYSNCLETIKTCNMNLMYMNQAINYTVAQLILDRVPPIGTFYTNYLKSVKKQAYAIQANKIHTI